MKLSQGTPIGDPLEGIGTLGGEGVTGRENLTVFESILSTVVGIITIIAGIWFLFLLVGGAIGIMSAGGDKGALEEAKKKMTTALIGMVVVVAGIFLADLIGKLIGFELLNVSGSIFDLGNSLSAP